MERYEEITRLKVDMSGSIHAEISPAMCGQEVIILKKIRESEKKRICCAIL